MFLTKIRASSADRSPYGDFWFNPVPSRGGFRTVTADRAMRLSAVFACIRVLAESFAVLPLRMYQEGTSRKQVPHWLLGLINRTPNPWQTGYEWREMMMAHLCMRGNAYNEIVTDRRGNITQFTPLHPDRMKVEWIGGGSEWDYRYRYTDRMGQEHVFVRGEIWHLRGLSSDGILGLSPLEVAAQVVNLGLAAQEYGARFFQNDAKPGGGWIGMPGNFKDKEARQQFRESWQEAQSGMNRGKVAVLEGGMEFHELGLSNKDSQFLEARQFTVTEIARIFRVPPHKIGDLSKATFSNIEQQSLEFVLDTMQPWAERWESSMESNFIGDDEGVDPEFDFKRLMRGDQTARAAYYQGGINSGWLTRNEARAGEGLEPLDGLDEPLRPLNMVEESAAEAQEDGIQPPAPAAPEPATAMPAPAEEDEASARLQAVLRGNAARMARRVAAGKGVDASTLAEALAITEDRAAAWLAAHTPGLTEATYIDQLMELGA